MRTGVLGVVAAGVLCGAGLVHGAGTAPFRYTKALTAPDREARSLGSIRLDDELLEATAGNYADLRIIDETGRVTPCTVRTLREKKRVTRELPMPMTVMAFRELPTNRVEIVLAREKDAHRAAALVLRSEQKNFEKQVTVHGSADGGRTWSELVSAQPIYDYTRFLDLRSSRVELPANDVAMLKVEIANISEAHQSPLTRIARETRGGEPFSEVEKTAFTRADFRIERIEVLRRVEEEVHDQVVSCRYPVRDLIVEEDAGRQETVLRFSSCRGPVRRIRVLASSVNFSRQATVEVRDVAGSANGWRAVAAGTISRISLGSYAHDASEIGLPGPIRIAEARVRIANMDSPPIAVEGVSLEGDVMETVFLRDAARTYRAYYGAQGLHAPRYDIGAVLHKAQTADTDLFAVGRQEENSAYGGAPRASWLNRKVVFTVAILLMVLVLVVVIAKAARGIDTLGGTAPKE